MKISIVNQAQLADASFSSSFNAGMQSTNKIILVEHKGVTLQWNILNKIWNSTDIETSNSSFDPINAYLSSLSPELQDNIFKVYCEIREVMTNTSGQGADTCEELIDVTRPLASKLFGLINQTQFYNWVWQVLRPNIPLNIKEHFDPLTMPGTRERTYLLKDYRGLIPLAIIVRMAVPFWMDFIYLTKGSISPEHRDMLVYSIIQGTWPSKCAAMERLMEFTTHTVGNDANHPAAILLGIGSDSFVLWALSGLVVSKLPTLDVMGNNTKAPVAPALFQAIRARVNQVTTGQAKITKKFAESSSNDDNNQSFLEGFRNRLALTIGQELTGSHYLLLELDRVLKRDMNPYGMLRRVCPDIDFALVQDCIKSANDLTAQYIIDEQVDIASWLFHPYSQCRATGNLHKEEMIALIGMAQAVFLTQGHLDFAILVSGRYDPNNLSANTVVGETISSIRPNDRAAFREHFPIEQQTRPSRPLVNMVFEDITAFAKRLQNYDITCTFSNEVNAMFRSNNPNRRYYIRRDAATMFMNLGVELATRPEVEIDPMKVFEERFGNKQA